MREHGISGLPKRRKGKPNPIHRETTDDLVNRDFHRDGPNQLWMTDITEHPTREGKLYCCVVLDAWSRKVVGWSLDRRPTAAMVNAALGMAIDSPRRSRCSQTDRPSIHVMDLQPTGTRAGLAHSLGTVGDASTTPWSNRSGPACRPSCSTLASGEHGSSCQPRSSIGSKPSTTASVDTARSA